MNCEQRETFDWAATNNAVLLGTDPDTVRPFGFGLVVPRFPDLWGGGVSGRTNRAGRSIHHKRAVIVYGLVQTRVGSEDNVVCSKRSGGRPASPEIAADGQTRAGPS